MVRALNKEFLEDYQLRESEEFSKFKRKLLENKFQGSLIYPPNERFSKILKPVVLSTMYPKLELWATIPLSGTLMIGLPPIQRDDFEGFMFEVTQIPQIIEFIKTTGRLQFFLPFPPLDYVGLDFLDPIFKELHPPYNPGYPIDMLFRRSEIDKYGAEFYTLAKIKFSHCLKQVVKYQRIYRFPEVALQTYCVLKLFGYSDLIDEIQDQMVLEPWVAMHLLFFCQQFITTPILDCQCNSRSYSLEMVEDCKALPVGYKPKRKKPHFPCEIGKFLLRKLTYYPESLQACQELIAHYDSYDLLRVAEALNRGIRESKTDVVKKYTEEMSQIMDNIWRDKSLSRTIEGLKIGIPVSMAAIGTIAAGPIGALGGFLAGLGFSVGNKLADLKSESISEKMAKFVARSYQATVYDFKKKYRIPH